MSDMVYRKIAAKIRALRDFKNITQTELAKKLGFKSGTSVGYWESAKKKPSPETLAAMADLFDIPRNYFFKEFANNAEEYGTAQIKEGLTEEDVLYLDAMADLVREIKGRKNATKGDV